MTRRHHIDALRALAFALLILYHWGMLYVGDWDWHIKSTHTSDWLQLPMLVVNRWRMSLIFLISGISSAFLLGRASGPGFLGQRTWRLLLPLVFGMLVIVPVQPYVQGIQTGFVKPGFFDFLARYYTGQPWPKDAFDGWEHGYTWNHLWYLAYLWVFTVALVLIRPLLDSRAGMKMLNGFMGLRGWGLLLLPALPIAIETVTLQGRFEDTGDLIHDGYRDVLYFTMFLYGFWLARADGIWDELSRLRRRSLVAALVLFPAYYGLGIALPDDLPGAQQLIWALRSLYIWWAIAAVLGWSKACLDRPFPWLGWANEAVFPWYVLHQSLIVLLAYWLVPLRLPGGVEATGVLVGTVIGCWVGFAIVRRVPLLRPLFGMKLRPRDQVAPAPALRVAAPASDVA